MGRLYDIGPGGTVMGRGQDVDITIVSDTVSRRHAQFLWLGETLAIKDLSSLNGTYLDDRRVLTPSPIHPGQMLRLGSVIFKILQGADIERRYHEEIYRMAIFDGLTNIHNKRYFMEFLEREHQRAVRHGRPLSLLMIDVDHFKSVNDDHGHINGDRLLRQVASRARGFVRRDECFARYGGEEFGMILPETGHKGSKALAEKVRRVICDTPMELQDGGSVSISISVGGAELSDGDSIFGFIGRADEALYAAKTGGRNRVEMAQCQVGQLP
jgi:diguanylate cyclase (GGDEF)-like protein